MEQRRAIERGVVERARPVPVVADVVAVRVPHQDAASGHVVLIAQRPRDRVHVGGGARELAERVEGVGKAFAARAVEPGRGHVAQQIVAEIDVAGVSGGHSSLGVFAPVAVIPWGRY